MMRKLFFGAVFILSVFGLQAQNLQLHYDLGNAVYGNEFKGKRPRLTSTVEMFHPDRWGSTFFFTDMDYTDKGVAAAYWEIARELQFWKGPVSLHVEYNGGLQFINNAYLLGATYSWNSSDFSKGYSLSAMYKYIQGNFVTPHNFQLTGVWYLHFGGGKYSFMGFADFWRENMFNGTEFTFLSEPQFWFNLNKLSFVPNDFNLSLGGEIELGYNFAARKGFYAIPTLGCKWTIK